MLVQDFLRILKSAKGVYKESAQFCQEFQVINIKDSMDYRFDTKAHLCNKCGRSEPIKRVLYFALNREPKRLTIFEAGLLYALFVKNETPKDYAQYHKCVAGIEFIEALEVV